MTESLWQLEGVSLGGPRKPGHDRLRDVSLSIHPGVTAVIGYSGAGKTSLLNLLVGFERPTHGRLTATLPRNSHALPLYWAPQNEGLWPHVSVCGHLQRVGAASLDLLDAFDLRHRERALPAELSQGERARLAVARALAADPAVLVMDEPLAHVDPARSGKYWALVRDHVASRGCSLLFATHDPPSVLREARHVIALRDGRVLFTGPVDELYWRPASAALAFCLGDANWLEPPEAEFWLKQTPHTPRCYRPEQITINPEPQSPIVLQSHRFAGSVAEAVVLHEPTKKTRRFLHRPHSPILRPGDRVVIRVCVTLMLMVTLLGAPAGCGSRADDPTLSIKQVHHLYLPPEGIKSPAPRSVAATREGGIIVLDTVGRVLVYDARGNVSRQWHMPEYNVGRPEGVRQLSDGRIVVCDTHYHRVIVFDDHGRELARFGTYGTGPGQFIYPVAVIADESDNLYIAEYGGNDRVQKFDKRGKFLLTMGAFGTAAGQFQRPSGMAWLHGHLYVADAINNRISVFSGEGQYRGVLGESVANGRASGGAPRLEFPYDVALGPDEHLYIVEYGAGRVTRLDLKGAVTGRFGSRGAGENQFTTPWGIAVDRQGRVIVADTGNRRLVELKL